MAKKITITTDEINSSDVDAKLRERGAPPSEDPQAAGRGINWGQILYNTLVYSTLFGLLGGLIAGLVGEAFWIMMPKAVENYQEYFVAQFELAMEIDTGEITDEEFERRSQELDRQYADNPIVAIQNDPTLDELEKEEQIELIEARVGLRTLVFVVFWFASVGMLLAFCLSIADQAMGQNLRGVMVNGSVAIALALVGTFFGACIASLAYNKLGGGDGENFALQVLARAIGWVCSEDFSPSLRGLC